MIFKLMLKGLRTGKARFACAVAGVAVAVGTLVSAELVKTLVGSFGLVLVAPFTAFVGAFVFSRPKARAA